MLWITNPKRQRGTLVDAVRFLTLRLFRPHRACLDGEEDGELDDGRSHFSFDPIQLARMKKIGWMFILALCGMLPLIAAAEEPTYQGAARCIDCHTQPSPLRRQDGTTDWVQLTEAHTWLAIDKHSQAFDVLTTDYSKKMGERLGIDDVTKDQRCLSCHAGWSKESGEPLHVSLGVSCESCHGPSSLYDLPHTAVAWRKKSVAEKAELGMIDVRGPARRAQQCLACHLGNVAEGKLLTHAMYAAGHPPLPGFEPVTFAQAMPPHWRSPRQKGQVARAANRERGLPEVKSVLIGGVAALRESVHLASDWRAASTDSGDWPDFAQFDCSACHHELERPSWRQVRPATGRPGELFAPLWPMILAELAARHVERHDPASGQRLRRAIEQPIAADGALGNALDELLRSLKGLTYDRAAAIDVLRDGCELGLRPYLDFDSARQLAWAWQSIYFAIDESQADAKQVQQILAEMTGVLQLDLPATRDRKILDPQRQRAMFGAVGDYQPGLVNARFVKLGEALDLP